MVGWKRILRPLILSILIVMAMPAAVQAASCATNQDQQSCSSSYGVSETHFGSGSVNDACSTTYCADQTAGDLNVGKTCSTSFCAQTGSDTDRMPFLQMIVNTTNVDLGVLKTTSTGIGTATFSVKAYLASGYGVQVVGSPPTNGAHALTPITNSAVQSTVGQEQFGINLVANTTACGAPANFGANQVQIPNSSFSFGGPTAFYGSCGYFKYVNGDTIAYSTSSSGETDYTISYIANISDVTPGGTYTTDQTLVATATY